MSELGSDILAVTETEILLKQLNHTFFKVVLKGIGVLVVLFLFGLLSTGELIWLCAIPLLLPLALAAWNLPDRTTRVIFNEPEGYVTIEESAWWSIIIPAGLNYFKTSEQIRLPNRDLVLEKLSGSHDHFVQLGTGRHEMSRSSVESLYVNIPLEDGSNYLLWVTNDQQTFETITERLNYAIESYKISRRLG